METSAVALFILMAGQWTGTGTRLDGVTHQPTAQITVQVQSEIQNDILISQNQVHELRSAQPYDYTYGFWLSPAANPGNYNLGDVAQGALPDTSVVAAVGHFDGTTLDIERQFDGGSADPFTVQSHTKFTIPGESDYSETVWYRGAVISTSQIHYHRASAPALRYN